MGAAQDSPAALARWQDASRAEHYARQRFAPRQRARDPRLVRALIERFDAGAASRTLLDVPAGTGRLAQVLDALAEETIGADRSSSMLAHASYRTRGAALVADARRLPFADDTFDVVVCARLLHHLDDGALRDALAETLRVARRLVVASWWDAACWTEWRKRVGLRRCTDARRSIPRPDFESLAHDAGGEILGHARSARLLSPQTFTALRPGGR